jgi:hypothetical protein
MTSQEAMKHECKPGYWLWNTSELGDTPNWVEQVKPYQQPTGQLFGYEESEFLRKQYY